ESEALRQMVYARTRRALRRRRLLRQFAYAAALLVSFGAGLLVMYAMTRPRVADSRSESERTRGASATPSVADSRSESERTRGASAPHSETLTQPRSHTPADEPALGKEWSAFDSDDRRGELYRQAGDSYIMDEND